MLYLWLKIIHVISSAILFGTGLGTAFYMFYVNCQKNIKLIALATKQVVLADWLFTGSSGIVQVLTGFAMIYLKHYSFTAFWIVGSIIGYCIAGLCWLPVVWLQIRCRDIALKAYQDQTELPKIYFRYFNIWWLLGILAFIALLFVFYFMGNKPL